MSSSVDGSMKARLERLDRMIADGDIIRGDWTEADGDGRRLACLLAALSPEAADGVDPSMCPAEVMPSWLAYMTVAMNDGGTMTLWPAFLSRYAAVARRWHVLDAAAWRVAEYRCRIALVREAMTQTTEKEPLAYCERVIAVLEKIMAGTEGEFEDEIDSLQRIDGILDAVELLPACSQVLYAGEQALMQQIDALSELSSWVQQAVFENSSDSDEQKNTQAAYDRMTDHVLGVIEQACTAAERSAAVAG